jgi:hypothetical protein
VIRSAAAALVATNRTNDCQESLFFAVSTTQTRPVCLLTKAFFDPLGEAFP